MVHAKNYETMSTNVKVMQKKLWPLFFPDTVYILQHCCVCLIELSSCMAECRSITTVHSDECSTAPGGRRPLDQANQLETQAHLYAPGVNHIHHRHLLLLLISLKTDTHFTVPRRLEGWVDVSGWLCSNNGWSSLHCRHSYRLESKLSKLVKMPILVTESASNIGFIVQWSGRRTCDQQVVHSIA